MALVRCRKTESVRACHMIIWGGVGGCLGRSGSGVCLGDCLPIHHLKKLGVSLNSSLCIPI